MKYIDEALLFDLLARQRHPSAAQVDAVLKKTQRLERLGLEDVACLLSIEDPCLLDKLFLAARSVKEAIYGNRIVLFAPLYSSNYCINHCEYCGFQRGNRALVRKALNREELIAQTECLLKKGHMRALLVSGESAPPGTSIIDYLTESIEAIYAAKVGPYQIKRVNVNCAPLSVDEFKTLKAAGIGTYQLFQETYHEATYRQMHTHGPKSDPDNRLEAIDRAFEAGLDDLGIGVLYGLYDYRFETLALMQHVEAMEQKHGVGPHTISMPRIEPAPGINFVQSMQYAVSDADFKKIVAVLRVAVPYTGLILSTRETPEFRDELMDLGISQISAESNTSPGGYKEEASGCETQSCAKAEMGQQFHLSDHRSLDEVVSMLMDKEFTPSFCAACYRNGRTGDVFMHLAKPGHIKMQCGVNALATLQEYLQDFASDAVREKGTEFVRKTLADMDDHSRARAEGLLRRIEAGERDVYI